ncbi:MAG: TerD family protein [Actinomycetota bacterium]
MNHLTLNLTKPGDAAPKLALNLNKGERFKVRLSWEGKADVDLHAIVCVNTGDGAKASSFEDILSTYNVRRRIGTQEVGTLPKAPDGSFEIHGGALKHSPDARDGDELDIDEWIEIDPGKLSPPSAGVIEIPLLAMIHPQGGGTRFGQVGNAAVVVENGSGEQVLRASLSSQFGEFVGVQMGSILIDGTGASFAAVGVGFNGDFNTVLGHFS